MLPLLSLILLTLSVFRSNVAALDITVQSDTIVGEPSLVLWTRQPSDGNDELTFDLRFIRPPNEDVGLAAGNIQASPTAQFGTVQVVFPSSGPFELVAVSGPDLTNLGESGQVTAFALPTTTSVSPTSTSQAIPSQSATTSIPSTSTTSGAHHKKNIGAIIGGTLGGLAFLLLVALVILFLRRRKPTENRRWTFHREMMVRPANLDINPTYPTISQSPSPSDVEQGLTDDDTSSQSGVVMIASPSGPRPLIKPIYRSFPLPPRPLNPRQEEIAEQIENVKGQITKLEQDPGPTQHIMLDDMQKQMSWLRSQIESAWAMGLTDVAPLGFTHDLAR